MKNKIINKLVLGALTMSFVACTSQYMDINSNPYQPGDLNPDDYALGSAMSNLAGSVISADVNTAQFTDCLLGGPLGGYFADSGPQWSATISNFNATDDWACVFLKSKMVIPVLYSNLTIVKDVSNATNNPVPYAIAEIIKVAAMSRITDTYGPIPYSQIGADGKISIPYDSQKDVYDKFFEELDHAIGVLTENREAALVPTADYVYGGNVQRWIKFANSLKLRLAIRIAYADLAKAKEMAESAVQHEIGLIESNVDNAKWDYFKTISNSLYTAIRYNADQTGGDSHAAADIICYMNGYSDERRNAYFETSKWTGRESQYIGLRRSIDVEETKSYLKNYSTIKISDSDPILWMNAAEVAFLRAEGKAIFKFDMGGEAADFYNRGIRLSFEQWGAGNAEEYLNDDSSTPTTYTDPAALNTYNTPISTITIKWDESATDEVKQERIITQKWIANWMLGNEAWADYRRTGYPRLIPATDKGNKSGGTVDSQKGARRMPYPLAEYTDNTANVQYAVDNYLKKPDNMATDLWWACKP